MKLWTAFLLASYAAFAGSPAAIGVVSANGHFKLEGSRIWGNSTLFEGVNVETADASSELALPGGVKVQLAAGSAARVWKNHIELTRGVGQVSAPSKFALRAGGVTVEGVRYQVGVRSDARLEVASLTGNARVLAKNGSLLASLTPGRNMTFAMQQEITRAGCLLFKGNGFILQVDNSPEVLQLTGNALAANLGNRVEITGVPTGATANITPATSVVSVSQLTLRAPGGCLTAAANLNAQTTLPAGVTPAAPAATATPAPAAPAAKPAATAGARTGMSTGAKVAIIGGIAGGGAGAALALSGGKDSTSP